MTQTSIVTEVPIVELLDQRTNENVVFSVSPRVGESEVMSTLIQKSMLKGELKALLTFGYAILLQRKFDPGPNLFIFVPENRKMALSEKFDLVAHVDYTERDSGSWRYTFYREVKPCSISRVRISLDP